MNVPAHVNSLTCRVTGSAGQGHQLYCQHRRLSHNTDLGTARQRTHLLHLIRQLAAQELEAVEADLQVTKSWLAGLLWRCSTRVGECWGHGTAHDHTWEM